MSQRTSFQWLCLLIFLAGTTGLPDSNCRLSKQEMVDFYGIIAFDWSSPASFPQAIRQIGNLVSSMKTALITCPKTSQLLDVWVNFEQGEDSLHPFNLLILDQIIDTFEEMAVVQIEDRVWLEGVEVSNEVEDNPLPKLKLRNAKNSKYCQVDCWVMFKRMGSLLEIVKYAKEMLFEEVFEMMMDTRSVLEDCIQDFA